MAGGLETSVADQVLLPLALAVVTFGMGMTLTSEDFRRVGRIPRAVGVGLAAQIIGLPLLAMLVGTVFFVFFGLPHELVIGLLVLACCPGGTTSNLFTWLARADAALSVTLTSITSLASALLTPFTFLLATRLLYGAGQTVDVSFGEMAGLVALIVAVPILLGMAVRSRRPDFAHRAEKPFRFASTALLALVIAGVILKNRADFWSLAAASVPAALALNAAALALGLLAGRLARVGRASERAIAIEVGFQNGTLGIAIAIAQLGSAQAAIVPGFYSLVMFATGGALAWWWARDTPAPEPAAPVGGVAADAPAAREPMPPMRR